MSGVRARALAVASRACSPLPGPSCAHSSLSPHARTHLQPPPPPLPNSTPFRNSTLTFLLSDSLSNDSKTLMFANMSPLASDADETICTLTFASRVRTVELGKATRNTSSAGGGKLQGGGGEE